jgi:hypothetical protein
LSAYLFLMTIPFGLDPILFWSVVVFFGGVLILLFVVSGKDYEPEPERVALRQLVDDYRTRATFHLENIEGVRKKIFQVKGLYQNNLFILNHETVSTPFLKEDVFLTRISYPLGGELLFDFVEQYPKSFFGRTGLSCFALKPSGFPQSEKKFFFCKSALGYLQGFEKVQKGELRYEGDSTSELESNEELWDTLTSLLDHLEKVFRDKTLPCWMVLYFESEFISVVFGVLKKHRFEMYSFLDKFKVDSILEIFDGLRGCQDETLEISRSDIFLAQSSIFRELGENSDLLVMDEIDNEFFSKFPELKAAESSATLEEWDELNHSKETRKMKPNEDAQIRQRSALQKKSNPSSTERLEAQLKEKIDEETLYETDTTKITIDITPIIPGDTRDTPTENLPPPPPSATPQEEER